MEITCESSGEEWIGDSSTRGSCVPKSDDKKQGRGTSPKKCGEEGLATNPALWLLLRNRNFGGSKKWVYNRQRNRRLTGSRRLLQLTRLELLRPLARLGLLRCRQLLSMTRLCSMESSKMPYLVTLQALTRPANNIQAVNEDPIYNHNLDGVEKGGTSHHIDLYARVARRGKESLPDNC